MLRHQAEDKADLAVEMELITPDLRDAYVEHLLETHNDINKGVDREAATSTDSNTDKE